MCAAALQRESKPIHAGMRQKPWLGAVPYGQPAAAVRLATSHLSLDSCCAVANFCRRTLAATPCYKSDETSDAVGIR